MFRLFKNISIYTIGGLLNKSAQFLLLPLYTSILDPSDFGKLELTYMVGAILAIVYGLLVESGYTRVYFDNKDTRFRGTLFTTGQAFNLTFSLIFIGISYIYAEEIARWLFDSRELVNIEEGKLLVILISVTTFLKVMSHIPLNNLRNREKATLFVMVNLSFLIINILLTVVFVAIIRTGILGILYANLIAGVIELAILYIITHKEMIIGFSISQLKTMLSFSIFLIVPNLSAFILNFSNRFFLKEYQSLTEVGLYSLAYKLSSIIPLLFTEPVKKAFGPFVFSLIDQPEQCKANIARFTRYFLGGIMVFGFILALFSKEIILIISKEQYHSSSSIVFILVLSYVFLGLSGLVVTSIQITKKTWIVTAIWPVIAIINIGLNLWFIPVWGRTGAALATLISFILINLSYFISGYYVYRVKYEYWKFICLFAFTSLFYYGSTFLSLGIFFNIIIKTLFLAIYCLAIFYSGYFTKNEIRAVTQKIRAKNSVLMRFRKNNSTY